MVRLTQHTPENFGYAEYELVRGADEQDVISRLGRYEDTGMTPDEVATTRIGMWDADEFGYKCSACGEYCSDDFYEYDTKNFCPNCGADMRQK